jgi:glycosyltransferase involved in cell wall biosynthesis
MSRLSEIEVLLATYNGDRFLREQINSILAQDYSNIRVLARDDGSTDETAEILSEYAGKYPDRFRVMPASAATGSAKENFLLLMKTSTADHICFSDQDDVWLPEKVRKTKEAMDRLEFRWGRHVPLLVFTDLHVVDDRLKMLHRSFWAFMKINPGHINRLAKLMVQSVVTGCTAMMNRPLLELALRMPSEASMHDRWIGLLASTMGRASMLNEQTVLYRQHDRNVVGTGQKATGPEDGKISFLDRVRRLKEGSTAIQWRNGQRDAIALLRVHGTEMAVEKQELIRAFLRCETSASRFVRIATLIRYGFNDVGISPNLARLAMLWTK